VIRFASLGSGSAGNALLVESGCTLLMVDCGFGLRESVSRLARLGRSPSELTGIFVTHEHGDHLGGVWRLARKFDIPIWMTHGTWMASAEPDLGLRLSIIDSDHPLRVGALEVLPFPVPHDAREPVQYLFSDGRRRLGVLTDIGEVTSHVCSLLSGCHGLVLECNHDAAMLAASSYPASVKRRIGGRLGHLDNAAAASLLEQIDCSSLQHVVAAHLSERNNRPELAVAFLARALGDSDGRITVASQGEGLSWTELT